MHKENEILIKASKDVVFETAADLSRWPRILPHYQRITYLERSATRNVVVMAANRGWMPIRWTSEQKIDRDNYEVRFHHLKSFTKGMKVVWSFRETGEGVRVRIDHDLVPTIPLVGRFIAEYIIGRFFIHYVAGKTLHHMKLHLEGDHGA